MTRAARITELSYGTTRLRNGMIVPTRDSKPLVDAPRNERVEFSEPEDDPTTQALLTERWVGVVPIHQIFRLVPQRRKRLVMWTEPNGERMGRWTWESTSPRMEVV